MAVKEREEVGVNQPHRVPVRKRWLRLAPPPPATATPAETPLDDEALIEAVLQGDTRRARPLHDRLVSAIEPTLYRVMGKREPDHDDLVQAALEQIILTLRRGRFARGCSLATWASAVAAHVAFNALRSRRCARRVFEPMESSHPDEDGETAAPGTVGDAERDMTVRARIRLAQAHLTAMNPDKAMVLVLHDVLGHELVEIAAMLGISTAAAQSRLVRARREFLERTKSEESFAGADDGN
jgi:RNA polymerase sigma factor (sigma-70 family)